MVARPDRAALARRSVEVIRAAQTGEGGYVACPSYPTYRYVWARDGAFAADAMRAWGEAQSAAAFHRFMARAILRLVPPGGGVPPLLPARFEPDGSLDRSGWPNFQTDGYGLWLWALARHAEAGSATTVAEAAAVAARYLAANWHRPCHDPWEEGGDRLPVATLAASVAGLRAAGELLGEGPWREAASAAWRALLADGVRDGHLVKDMGVWGGVDAATLWALSPLGLFAPDDPVAVATLRETERRLGAPGVHRHPDDVYYGGGAWPILSALWGLACLGSGDAQAAARALVWMEGTVSSQGDMPEQVPDPMLHPEGYEPWVIERGPIATPLTWSHAMYLSLAAAVAPALREQAPDAVREGRQEGG